MDAGSSAAEPQTLAGGILPADAESALAAGAADVSARKAANDMWGASGSDTFGAAAPFTSPQAVTANFCMGKHTAAAGTSMQPEMMPTAAQEDTRAQEKLVVGTSWSTKSKVGALATVASTRPSSTGREAHDNGHRLLLSSRSSVVGPVQPARRPAT